jgi:hypothetical protein
LSLPSKKRYNILTHRGDLEEYENAKKILDSPEDKKISLSCTSIKKATQTTCCSTNLLTYLFAVSNDIQITQFEHV